jgi:uncharacterized protein
VIPLEVSALFALINRKDPHHPRVRTAFHAALAPYLISVGILAEIGYLVERRLGQKALSASLSDIEAGRFTLDCGKEAIGRARELAERYARLPLGFANACVIACAESNGGTVLVLDKHFQIVAAEGKIRVLP